MTAPEKLLELIKDARGLCLIANAGRKREDYPQGRQYADDAGELGQWLLADCLTKAADALEVLLQPVNLNGVPIQTARALEYFHESLIEEMMK